MYNYASLVAEQHALQSYKTLFSLSDVDKVSEADVEKVFKTADTLLKRNKVLDRQMEYETEEDMMLFCIAELFIHKHITHELWSSGQVAYRIKLKKQIVSASGNDVAKLTVNKMMLAGYEFEEVIGEHFVVITPNRQIRATNGISCSCAVKNCLHNMAVKEITGHRKLYQGLYSIKH